jgi:phosphopantothenoylcysteine decarboxylase / phosphopantothenate---cysteine ligase
MVAFFQPKSLLGKRVLITAGPTFEPIDPVRGITNLSSGKMGFAIARAACEAGAQVTLVAGPVHLPTPRGVQRIDVRTAQQMHDAVLPAATQHDVFVATAAVADWRPASLSEQKIKKNGSKVAPTFELTENPDILADLARRRRDQGRPDQVIVGFAAETNPDLDAARAKLARKGCDLLVMNQVGNGQGFGQGDNEWIVLDADGTVTGIPRRSKDALADEVLALVSARLTPIDCG